MSRPIITSAAIVAGTALVGTLSIANLAQAGDNPFVTEQLESGYVQLAAEGSCGEGKCGAKDGGEGQCGAKGEGEGKCGEGKCGNKG